MVWRVPRLVVFGCAGLGQKPWFAFLKTTCAKWLPDVLFLSGDLDAAWDPGAGLFRVGTKPERRL